MAPSATEMSLRTISLKEGREILTEGRPLTSAEARALAKAAFNLEGDCVAARNYLERISDRTPAEMVEDALLEAKIETQTGHYQRAREICQTILQSPPPQKLAVKVQMDTLCLIARTFKDEWQNGEEDSLLRAAKGYADTADSMEDQHFPAINAATMYHMLDDAERSKSYARRAKAICLAEINAAKREGQEAHYWTCASLAEAEALIGSETEAHHHYRMAADMAWKEGSLRDVASMRRQARWIGQESYDQCFNLPDIFFFAGHMIDAPGRLQPRFHSDLIPKVSQEVEKHLQRLGPVLAYGSAACGADLIIAEAILARREQQKRRAGAVDELYLMLSGPPESFVRDSVRVGPADLHDEWAARFERVTSAAATLQKASTHAPAPGSVAYHYTNQFMIGEGLMKANTLDLDTRALVVWDEKEWGNGSGGTSDVVHLLRTQGIEPFVINPLRFKADVSLRRENSAVGRMRKPKAMRISEHHDQEIMAFLFADTVHFSLLTEIQVKTYLRAFMGKISCLISHSKYAPRSVNTWGDALYMIFDDVRAAGQFALDLRDELDPAQADWESEDLPAELSIRLALHVGPAFCVTDPVTRTITYTGRHVTYAARMEPVVPAGEVNASAAFAALAAMEDHAAKTAIAHHPPIPFRCQYRGQVQLAKKYAEPAGIYRLIRKPAPPRTGIF